MFLGVLGALVGLPLRNAIACGALTARLGLLPKNGSVLGPLSLPRQPCRRVRNGGYSSLAYGRVERRSMTQLGRGVCIAAV
jgi:hypothetical protein